MKHRNRLGVLLGGASLLAVLGSPAQAIEFEDLRLARPDGVAGLMFDDRLCFPPDWLAVPALAMLGELAPQDLWLQPIIYFGTYVEAREPQPTPAFAAEIRAETVADTQGLARMQVEYNRLAVDGFLWFLQCLADTDEAVFDAYLATAGGLLTGIAALVAELRTADPERRAAIAGELAAAGPAVLPALRGLLAEPALLEPEQEETALAVLGIVAAFGPEALEAAAEAVLFLGVTTDPVREAARNALVAIGPDVVDIVLDQAVVLDSFVRLDAMLVLGAIEPPPLRARPTLDGLARLDPVDEVRAAAAAVVARIDAARGR